MRKWLRTVALLTCAGILLTGVAGCGKKDSGTSADAASTVYKDKDYGFQLDKPTKGDTIAVMHTTKGDISLRFFPEAAPKAVENFTTHAKKGYYNNLTFHRVMNDFMIQGGDPKGDGTGGESIWGSTFKDEFDDKLLNLRGSLSMANSGADTNGSQFFINQAKPQYSTAVELKAYWVSVQQQYKQMGQSLSFDPTTIPDAVWEVYAKNGGNIHLDQVHTVFGQVYDGMDVVDAIAAVDVDSQSKPTTAVLITSIDISTYAG